MPTTGTYTINPILVSFYQNLGGEGILGPVISNSIQFDGRLCQYTTNSLICFDQSAPENKRLSLAPIGKFLGINSQQGRSLQNDGNPVENSNPVYPAFMQENLKFLNAEITGKPLTSAIYNYSEKRVEQYFENVALYTRFDDPPGKYGLLPYGAVHCGKKCIYETDPSLDFQPYRFATNHALTAGMEIIGTDWQLTGVPLTIPYTAKDGNLEQVFENVVVFSPPDNPEKIGFRPLPSLAGMTSIKPGKKLHDKSQNVTFYEIKNGLGYHVPLVFDAFIQKHGGREVSGNPIADTLFYDNKIPRQCFRNYCLENNTTASSDLQVTPVSLGKKYLEKVDKAYILDNSFIDRGVSLGVNKAKQQVANYETQTIQVKIINKADSSPRPGVYPSLSLTLPGVYDRLFTMPVTGLDGRSEFRIPAFEGSPSGTMVPYQVCIFTDSGSQLCQNDAFLVWSE
jgi:hypothetical protein